jgi:glycosyltransferase involved in cell wall biosynthesis
VIASRAGGLPDKVRDGISGFLVAPGNASDLAERLATSIEVDRDVFGKAGRELCESRFSRTVVRRQHLELYERLIRSAAGRP